jgi:hypothetical protein
MDGTLPSITNSLHKYVTEVRKYYITFKYCCTEEVEKTTLSA